MASRRRFDEAQLVGKVRASTSSALLDLAHLLARQAAREILAPLPLETKEPADGEA